MPEFRFNYFEDKETAGFEVVELAGGRSNVTFSWHVVANRRDEELRGAERQPDGSMSAPVISHYQDLRFPVHTENLKTVQVAVTPPKQR